MPVDGGRLKAKFLEDLCAPNDRLKSVERLAYRVVKQTEQYRDTRIAPGRLFGKTSTPGGKFLAERAAFNLNNKHLDASARAVLGEPYWYALGAELTEGSGDAARVLPYGPAPGMLSIEAPNYTTDTLGPDTARAPLKRALVQLMLSYWADGPGIETAASKGLQPRQLLANLPYVEEAWSAVEPKEDERGPDVPAGLFLETVPPRSALIPLEELLCEYKAIAGGAGIRSPRAAALVAKLGITEIAEKEDAIAATLNALRARTDVDTLLQQVLEKLPRERSSGADPTATVDTQETLTAVRRVLVLAPDTFHSIDSQVMKIATNLITQVLYTIWFLQRTFDCTLSNVALPFLYVVDEDKTATPEFHYLIGETLLKVPNEGVRVVFADLEHAVLTARFESRISQQSETKTYRAVYHITSSRAVSATLAESIIPIASVRMFAASIAPQRFDPSRDLTMFFNSLALEPRWALHKHPLVTHYLGHEERAHVLAFGHNHMFRRVALDQSIPFGAVRQDGIGASVLGMLDAQLAVEADFLLEASKNKGVRSLVTADILDALTALVEFYRDYNEARRVAPGAETAAQTITRMLRQNVLRCTRVVGSLATIHRVVEGSNSTLLDKLPGPLRKFTAVFSVLWNHKWNIVRLVNDLLYNASGFAVTRVLVALLGRPQEQETQVVSLLKRGATLLGITNEPQEDEQLPLMTRMLAVSIWTKGLKGTLKRASLAVAEALDRDVQFAARQLLKELLPGLAATYAADMARTVIQRHMRPLLTRSAIVAGEAVPANVAFAPFQMSISTLDQYIRHALMFSLHGTPASRPMRSGKLAGRKKKIAEAMEEVIKRLDEIKRSDTASTSMKESILLFAREREIKGMVTTAEIRKAACEEPTKLVRWFANPEAIVDASPILDTLIKNKNTRLGSGKQGFVVGYAEKSGDAFRAIKLSNAVSDANSLRPVEMTKTSVVAMPQINEIIVSAILSDMYERGVSPHFMLMHGAMLSRIDSATAFVGRTGTSVKNIETAIDEFVVDLLEREHGTEGTAFALSTVASTLTIVLMESMIASTALRIGDFATNVLTSAQALFTVLQRSAEDIGQLANEGGAAEKLAELPNAFATGLSGLSAATRNIIETVARSTHARHTTEAALEENAPNDEDDDSEAIGTAAEQQQEAKAVLSDEDDIVDLFTSGRLIGIYESMRWLARLNPVVILAALDALRRVFNMVGSLVHSSAGTHPSDSASINIPTSASAAQSLRTFAAYKAQGLAALPARLRVQVEAWTRSLDAESKRLQSGAAENESMFQIVSSMEAIDGDFAAFPDLVVKLQTRLAEELREKSDLGGSTWQDVIPTLDEYVENAIVQTILALAQFQQHVAGNHYDFHPANIFIKLCDDMTFNGKRLSDYDYFEYTIGAQQYRVRNLGFVVKLADMGHATLSLQRAAADKSGTSIDVTLPQEEDLNLPRLVVHKSEPVGVEALFAHNTNAMRYILDRAAASVPNFIPAGLNMVDVVNKIVGNLWARHKGAFLPAYDLGHFMNACAMLPFSYRNRVVHAYHTTERMRWIAEYGSIDGMPNYAPNVYVPLLARYAHPIAEKQLTTPREFLEGSRVFDAYRVAEKKV
jgi:hypothetical protein